MVSGIVAEMSNAANGKLENAFRLIEGCAAVGADWIKFQAYTPKELAILRGIALDEKCPIPAWSHMTMGELYGKAQTPHDWFPELVAKCEEVGIPWFSSVFGTGSLRRLEGLGCPVYKLASLDRLQADFRDRVLATGKPLIQSSPEPMDLPGVTQLYCPPGYPQTIGPEDLIDKFPPFDGFSFHGTETAIPETAYHHGAKIIECHVMLDDEPSELEANVSLTVSQLAELVEACK